MDKITAPYNFVPLSEKVFFPQWSERASQDIPFEEGLCGTLELEIEALTPIFVRGQNDRGEGLTFFKTPDNRFAIPGSSIRGALRNVIEIASFAKFRPVRDATYGVRDLHNPQLYGNKMSVISKERGAGQKGGALVPLVCAGWMTRGESEEVPAQIKPCSFAKIEYGYLMQLDSRFNPGRKQSGPEKYRAWSKSLDVRVQVSPPIGRDARPQGFGDYAIVQGLDGKTEGKLVFTGQPSEWSPNRPQARKGGGKPKHHDFVFYDTLETPIGVSKEVFDAFRFIHCDRGQQDRRSEKPNAEWGYWAKRFEEGKAEVPVFFLVENGRIKSVGLAMMFRLAYRNSIGTLASRNQPERDSAKYDLPETLFGTVASDDLRRRLEMKKELVPEALRGRVSFSLAACQGAKPAGQVRAVLGAPKPTFYPNYVEQHTDPNEPGAPPVQLNGKPSYLTFMDDQARLRGWKRYRPQDADLNPALPPKARDTRFQPLAAGAKFRCRVRLHNVLPKELGALLWALDFGGAEGAVHTLGMARSLGFGRVRFTVKDSSALVRNDGGAVGPNVREECIARFVETMETWAKEQGIPGGWRESVQLRELLACAKPLPPGSKEGKHLDINHPYDRNQFAKAKKDGLALVPASGISGKAVVAATAAGPARSVAGPGGYGGRPGRGGDGRRGAPQRGRGRFNDQAARPGPPPKVTEGPKSGMKVKAVLLEEKTKKGGWMASLAGDEKKRKGAIQNSPEVPAEAESGAEVELVVAMINDKEIAFRWPK
ncbi:MAG: TIGR03986 family CRISPR-associated RAMP protein [Myxococcales bacterium]|jgi:CRISPR-associated protein (TIGR03986 family)